MLSTGGASSGGSPVSVPLQMSQRRILPSSPAVASDCPCGLKATAQTDCAKGSGVRCVSVVGRVRRLRVRRGLRILGGGVFCFRGARSPRRSGAALFVIGHASSRTDGTPVARAGLVDAAVVAVPRCRSWLGVRARGRLGARRLGSGPRAPLRLSLADSRCGAYFLRDGQAGIKFHVVEPVSRRFDVSAGRLDLRIGVELLPIRGGRAAWSGSDLGADAEAADTAGAAATFADSGGEPQNASRLFRTAGASVTPRCTTAGTGGACTRSGSATRAFRSAVGRSR